eukprot:1159440-Pelagomonas_calceolata.AAC.9
MPERRDCRWSHFLGRLQAAMLEQGSVQGSATVFVIEGSSETEAHNNIRLRGLSSKTMSTRSIQERHKQHPGTCTTG